MKTWKEDHCLAQDKEDSTLYLEYSILDLPITLNSDTMSLANSLSAKAKVPFLLVAHVGISKIPQHRMCLFF